jgi:hypothetical protein
VLIENRMKHSKHAFYSLVVIPLALTGCGSSSSSTPATTLPQVPDDQPVVETPSIPGTPTVPGIPATTPVGLLSGVSVGDTAGTFASGSPPAAVGTVTVSPLDKGVLPTIIAGGSIEIPVTADQPFSRIYVVSDTNGYFDIQLPLAVSEAVVVVTAATDQGSLAQAEIGVQVETAGGAVSESQLLPVAPLVVGTGNLQVSISWDQATDVDLHLTTPGGQTINWLNDTVGNGMLDLDSNAICAIDGVNNENITFSDGQPAAGQYRVEVDYFSECGIVTPTSYVVTVRDNGQTQTFRGQLVPADVTAGPRLITTIEIL